MALVGLPRNAVAVILTVGAPGSGCNHTNVQAAVDAANSTAGADEIRIARDSTWTAQQISIDTNEEVHLVGGYATCASAVPEATRTTLSGAGGAARPVLTIRGNGFVFLRGLTISDGDQAGSDAGGGINYVGGGGLYVDDSTISQNMAGSGGGIYAVGTTIAAEVILGDNVTITSNTARHNGGGIAMAGLELEHGGADSSILFNEALGEVVGTGLGGGVYVTSTDDFAGYLYVSAGGIGGLGAIYGNTAVDGGGIALIGGEETALNADARIFTRHANAPVRINGNIASGRGGAMYLHPDGDTSSGHAYAIARLWYAFVTDNEAADGGAIYLDYDTYDLAGAGSIGGDAVFNPLTDDVFGLYLPVPLGGLLCPNGAACGAISGNRANATTGAIVKHNNDGYFSGRRLLLQDNEGTRLVDVAGEGYPRAHLFNSLITGNTVSQELIRQPDDNGYLSMYHVTITDNTIGAPHVIFVNSTLSLYNSIVWQPGKQMLAAGADELNAGYVITNDPTNAVGQAWIAAPRFVDPSNGDHRLRAGSTAVDGAQASPGFPQSSAVSLDGTAHGIDIPDVGSTSPVVRTDIGAFERPALLPLLYNADFNVDRSLWGEAGEGAIPSWDGTQNKVGPEGSGSLQVDADSGGGDGINAPNQAGPGQCVHLPKPGLYQLNSWARALPVSSPQNPVPGTAYLKWELRYNGGPLSCLDGAPDQSGELVLAAGTSNWIRPGFPAVIELPPGTWTPHTSLIVKPGASGFTPEAGTGWFDGITLDLLLDDSIFVDGFEAP